MRADFFIIFGFCAVVAGIAAIVVMPSAAAPAWLIAASSFLGLPLGALWILPIHALTGGRWGNATGPILRRLLMLLPFALLLYVPLLLAQPMVFTWMQADPSTLPETVQKKLDYLSQGWIALRFLGFAIVWLAIGTLTLLRRRSLKALSPVILIVHAVVTTGFCTDWMLALEPRFLSSIYPALVATGWGIAALAASMILLHAEGSPATMAGGRDDEPLGSDLAKLLLAGLLFWAYLAFMQYLIVWSGNLPQEISWYLDRNGPIRTPFTLLSLVVFCGGPGLLLLGSKAKRDPLWLHSIAGSVLVGYVLMTVWRLGAPFAGWDFAVLLAIDLGGFGLIALGFLVKSAHIGLPDLTREVRRG